MMRLRTGTTHDIMCTYARTYHVCTHYYTQAHSTVTLDIECYEDLDVENQDWRELLDLQGDESVEVSVRDYSDDVPVW